MKLQEAMNKEFNRGMAIIGVTADAPCHVCAKAEELRAGTCFDCAEADLVETDMIEVWEVAKPENRWPYAWHGEPFMGGTEQQAAQLQKAVTELK